MTDRRSPEYGPGVRRNVDKMCSILMPPGGEVHVTSYYSHPSGAGVGQPGAIMQMLYRLRVVSGFSLKPDVSVRMTEVASGYRL